MAGVILNDFVVLCRLCEKHNNTRHHRSKFRCIFYTSAILSTSSLRGQPFGGLAIIWKTKDNISCFPVFLTEKIMVIAQKTAPLKYAMLSVYLPYEKSTSQWSQDYQSSLDDLTNYNSDGCFDEKIMMGGFNCDPNKGHFFRELESVANRHCCDSQQNRRDEKGCKRTVAAGSRRNWPSEMEVKQQVTICK